MMKFVATTASAAAALALVGALLVPVSAGATEPSIAVHSAEARGETTPPGVEAGGGAVVPDGQYGVAARVIREGGVWTYGTHDGLFSNYWHKTRAHGSSVINGNGQRNTSPDVRGGLTSHSRINKTFAGNTAYWRIR